MNQAMKKAKETFAQGNYTCVWCRDDELLTSKEAGLRPLLTRIPVTCARTADGRNTKQTANI